MAWLVLYCSELNGSMVGGVEEGLSQTGAEVEMTLHLFAYRK